MAKYIVRAKTPDDEEEFYGTWRSYEKAAAVAENLVSGYYDDAQVEELKEYKFMSRWRET